MKAIHNINSTPSNVSPTVFNTSKIQNESNSQHKLLCGVKIMYCV